MKYACLYSIVRFAPFADTEEFANIGIVLTAPAVARMEFRLARRNFKRVNQFFECPDLYAQAVDIAQNELDRIQTFTRKATETQIAHHFRFLTEAKETLIRFSPARPVMVNDISTTMEDLYGRYIERQFEGQPRRETQMVKEIRTLFEKATIKHFHEDTLEGELTKLHLPLVYRQNKVAAIKPLAFDQAEPNGILEHCDTWVCKLENAAEEQLIDLKNVLIPVAMPNTFISDKHRKATEKATAKLRQRGMVVVGMEQHANITAFAKQFRG